VVVSNGDIFNARYIGPIYERPANPLAGLGAGLYGPICGLLEVVLRINLKVKYIPVGHASCLLDVG
jgi:hypothetical protein